MGDTELLILLARSFIDAIKMTSSHVLNMQHSLHSYTTIAMNTKYINKLKTNHGID